MNRSYAASAGDTSRQRSLRGVVGAPPRWVQGILALGLLLVIALIVAGIAPTAHPHGPQGTQENLLYQSGYADGYNGVDNDLSMPLATASDCAIASDAETTLIHRKMHPEWSDSQQRSYAEWYDKGCSEGLADQHAGKAERQFN